MWEHCAQIEKNGGNVLSYLKSEGYVSPRGTWFNLQDEFSGRKRSQFTDGKPGGKKIMGRKITLEDKKNAVKVALGGGDPEEYLRSLGIKDTRQTWYRIRADLKTADPETWERLEAMKKEGRRKKEPEPEETAAPVQKPKNDNPPQIVKFKGKHGEVQKVKLYGENEEKGTEKVVHANPMDDSLSEIIEKFQKSPEKKKLFEEMKKRFEVQQEPIQQKNPEEAGHYSVRAEDVEEFSTPVGEEIKRITDEIMKSPDKDRILKDLEKKLTQPQEQVQPQKTEEDVGLKICMLKGKKNIYRMYGDELTIMNSYGALGEKYNLGSVEDVELFIKELKEAIKRFTA
jgi:hypothetical protein